jgi:hypothetical protein
MYWPIRKTTLIEDIKLVKYAVNESSANTFTTLLGLEGPVSCSSRQNYQSPISCYTNF